MKKLTYLLQSRKFWALVISLTAIWTAFFAGGMPLTEAIRLTVAALAAYAIGTGLDSG